MRIVTSKNGTGGIYELGFRAPTSPWMEGAESILQSSVVFIFAVLITIAAPGVVPVQQYFRLVGILAAVLLVFLVLRWVGVVRSHKALVPVASDTLLALMYFGVAYGLPIWRKHSEAASVAGKSGDVVTETSNNKPV